MSKVLELYFRTTQGKMHTVRIGDPRSDLTAAQCAQAGQQLVNANIFTGAAGDLLQYDSAAIRDTQVIKIS
ncbi:MAG: DUF2922 domain-containing protein [Negativicutes bacterium]|nr:DUF2922 domain-containing protein [Negativicutes bacterium]